MNDSEFRFMLVEPPDGTDNMDVESVEHEEFHARVDELEARATLVREKPDENAKLLYVDGSIYLVADIGSFHTLMEVVPTDDDPDAYYPIASVICPCPMLMLRQGLENLIGGLIDEVKQGVEQSAKQNPEETLNDIARRLGIDGHVMIMPDQSKNARWN